MMIVNDYLCEKKWNLTLKKILKQSHVLKSRLAINNCLKWKRQKLIYVYL